MVQLKVSMDFCVKSPLYISIPDGSIKSLNVHLSLLSKIISIPDGSIKRTNACIERSRKQIFQFQMVQLKVLFGEVLRHHSGISIPDGSIKR